MSTFKNDQQFAENVAKGNLAELLFERLAVHSGWYVRYTGDQYHGTISPKKMTLDKSKKTPDFNISRYSSFRNAKSVEVKYEKVFQQSPAAHAKGKEDIRVVLSPDDYAVYPPGAETVLRITKEDWQHSVAFLFRAKKA
jgi:hypothetical protein